MTIHVSAALIADDDDFFRLALRNVLTQRLSIPHVTETASLDDAIDALSADSKIGLVLFDLNMPGMDTFAGIRATRETFPGVTVIVVSGSMNRRDVLRALDSGAHGYVSKGDGLAQLVRAIAAVCNGEVHVPTLVTELGTPEPEAAVAPVEERESDQELAYITPRQREVLQLVAKGLSNKEIARSLSLSESSIKFHVASLCARLGVRNRTEIAVRAGKQLR